MKLPETWSTRARNSYWLGQVDFGLVTIQTLVLGLSFAVLIGIPFVVYHRAESSNNLRLLQNEQERVLELAANTIRQEMDGALSDLRYLSQHNELKDHLAQPGPATRRQLANEYLGLVRQKGSYDQIRFIGLDGREEVRVNFNDGNPEIVPEEALQDKSGRYYVEEALWLSPGQIYVSPFDLNVEQVEVEVPLKPVMRFATPVADELGLVRGLVVTNYLGERLRDELRALQGAVGRIQLLDAAGYWLLNPDPSAEMSFMFPQRPPRTLAVESPDLWRQMEREASGIYRSAKSWVVFKRIYPLRDISVPRSAAGFARPVGAERYHWTVAVEIHQEALEAVNAGLRRKLRNTYAVFALFGFMLAGVLAFTISRNRALARVTQSVLDNLPQLVSYVDREQRYRYNNPAYERFFGHKPREIYGKPVPELLGEAAYADIRPFVERALAGETVMFERQLAYQGAGLRDVVVTYLPDVGADGGVRGFYGIITDVTMVKDVERRERQRMAELAHVSRLASMGEMASEIAHEINQPLAAISMYSAAGLRTLKAGDGQGQLEAWLAAINAQAKRASEVIRRLRRFLRKGEMQQGSVDMNQIVQEAADLLAHDAKSRHVAVQLELAADLPQVQGDRVLLQQVVFNLGRNAVDALHDQPGERRVTLRTRYDDSRVSLEVADNGPGVDPALGERVFDSFVSSKHDGLGMGLTISRSIVEAHAARLRYVANPQGGAIFTFSLEREQPR
jgi:PAS domain S-box-containing protein